MARKQIEVGRQAKAWKSFGVSERKKKGRKPREREKEDESEEEKMKINASRRYTGEIKTGENEPEMKHVGV